MVRIINYLIISLVVTLFDFFFLIFLIEICHIYYLVATTISFISALLSKFTLTKQFIFKDRDSFWLKEMSRFTSVSISGLATTNFIMFIGVDLMLISYIHAKMVSVVVVFFITFTLHNLFSFRSTKEVQ